MRAEIREECSGRGRMLAVEQDGKNGLNQTERAEISAASSMMLVRKNKSQRKFIRGE